MSLFFRSFSETKNDTHLKQAFRRFGECFFYSYGKFGFVVYQEREQGQAAMNTLSGQVISGVQLQIELNYKDDQPAPINTSEPSNIIQMDEQKELQDKTLNPGMKIEDDAQNGDERQPSLSLRERLYNAVENGLEKDPWPEDINFFLLYFNAQLDWIVEHYVISKYWKKRLFEQLFSSEKANPSGPIMGIILKDLEERIKKLDSFQNLIEYVMTHFKGSTDAQIFLESIIEGRVYERLQNGYESFIQKNILSDESFVSRGDTQ